MMNNTQTVDAFLIHLQLQAIIYHIPLEMAFDYALLNFLKQTQEISLTEFSDTLLCITADRADTPQQWEDYLDFAAFVSTLCDDYYYQKQITEGKIPEDS